MSWDIKVSFVISKGNAYSVSNKSRVLISTNFHYHAKFSFNSKILHLMELLCAI